jgi:NAD(P)-dependent dehydrogenase (short-subunit alcohol dehydrogenase family)
MTTKTLFITGISTGFGKALAEEALTAGYNVVGTVRNQQAKDEFDKRLPGRSHAVILDVTDLDRIPAVVAQVETEIAPIDALVNNAGYGIEAPVEESPMVEIRRQFEVNFFGAIAVAQAVLPYMRKRRNGRILNITSMGGLVTFPGVGIYNASKFALEGASEALGKEVAQFGIFVTAVEPGMFRTDWAGRSMRRLPRTISDYDAAFAPQREARAQRSGKQQGDPRKAAKAMLQILEVSQPPAHLLLGPDAVKYVSDNLTAHQKEIADWRHISDSTDLDE